MLRSNSITIGILVLIVGVAAWFAYQSVANNAASRGVSEAIDDLVPQTNPYTDLQGNHVDLAEYEGQVRVVNSWASWCPFCVQELPDLNTVAAEFADQDVVVLAINRGESSEKVKNYLRTITAPVEDIIFVQDMADQFYDAIGGFSMPETVFYTAAGEIAVHKRGFMTVEEMRRHVNTALEAN